MVMLPSGPGRIVLGVLLTALSIQLLPSQISTGTIVGTVTDPTGAVIPIVEVTAANVATGVSRSAKTDGAGAYVIPFSRLGCTGSRPRPRDSNRR